MSMRLTAIVVAVVSSLSVWGAEANPIYLKADATGSGDGSSWANACTDIHAAVGLLANKTIGS